MEKDSEGNPPLFNLNKTSRHCFIFAIVLLFFALVGTVYLAAINKFSAEMIVGSDLALAAIFIAFGFYFRDDFKNKEEQKDEILSSLKKIRDQLDQIHPTTHGIYQTQNDTLENTRVAYEFRNQRSVELAGYNRLLDAGIWGFVGFAFVELFKDNWSNNTIIFFCIIVIIAMAVWRIIAIDYNKDIVGEYIKILYCECALDLNEEISLKNSLIPIMDNKTEYDGLTNQEQYYKLIRDLKYGKKPDNGGRIRDGIAGFFIILAIVILHCVNYLFTPVV